MSGMERLVDDGRGWKWLDEAGRSSMCKGED